MGIGHRRLPQLSWQDRRAEGAREQWVSGGSGGARDGVAGGLQPLLILFLFATRDFECIVWCACERRLLNLTGAVDMPGCDEKLSARLTDALE